MGSSRFVSPQNNTEKCLILVKALPHASGKYAETVCCAGLTPDTNDPAGVWTWRRQYPVPYRRLKSDQEFRRWDWIEYQYRPRKADKRWESRTIFPETLKLCGRMNSAEERSRYVSRLVRSSTGEAESNGESLCLIRPSAVRFTWQKRSKTELEQESNKHKQLAQQLNFLEGKPPSPLPACPYKFKFKYRSDDRESVNQCEDWETSAAFFRRRRAMPSEQAALESLKRTYEEDYARNGLLFAMGTHSFRKIWLLVGVLRVDPDTQNDLFLN